MIDFFSLIKSVYIKKMASLVYVYYIRVLDIHIKKRVMCSVKLLRYCRQFVLVMPEIRICKKAFFLYELVLFTILYWSYLILSKYRFQVFRIFVYQIFVYGLWVYILFSAMGTRQIKT